MGDLWAASARGWGWAVESRSSQRSGGGGSPGELGAEGVRETGEERAGSGIEIQKGKLSQFVVCYCLSSSQRNEPNNNPHPPPPSTKKSGQCQDCKPHFSFLLSFVRSLAVSVFFLVLFFFLLPLPFLQSTNKVQYKPYFSL